MHRHGCTVNAFTEKMEHVCLFNGKCDRRLYLQLVRDSTIAALKWLGQKEHTFIFWDKDSDCYECHAFGKAVLASGLPPEMCMTIKVGQG